MRQLEKNSPFSDVIVLLAVSKNSELPFEILNRIKNKLKKQIRNLIIYGPNPAPIFNFKGIFRVCLYMKYQVDDEFYFKLAQIKKEFSKNSQISLDIDVNPINFM